MSLVPRGGSKTILFRFRRPALGSMDRAGWLPIGIFQQAFDLPLTLLFFM